MQAWSLDAFRIREGLGAEANIESQALAYYCNIRNIKSAEVSGKSIPKSYSNFSYQFRRQCNKPVSYKTTTVKTLILHARDYINVPYVFIAHSSIVEIRIFLRNQTNSVELVSKMNSVVKQLYSPLLQMNHHLRKIRFTHMNKDYLYTTTEDMPLLFIINRNQKLFKKRQQTTILLLGMAKFRKKPHGLNRDVMNLMAKCVHEVDLSDIKLDNHNEK